MHGRQAVCPSAFWYSPGSQALHFGALELLVNCPAPHSVQISSSSEFFSSNFPARQSMHEVAPSLSGSRPSEHVLQPDLLASSWYLPLVQKSQSWRFSTSARLCFPGRQGRHDVFPLFGWYSPGSHAMHWFALEPLVNCPAPHSVQISSSSEFFSSNFPARQLLQAVFPFPSGFLPVAHVGHGVVRLTSFDAVPIAQSSQSSRLVLFDRPCLPCWQFWTKEGG